MTQNLAANAVRPAAVANRYVQPFAGQDIRSLLLEQAARRDAHPCLVWCPFDAPVQRWTYRQFCTRIERVAAGLHARGVRAGDRVLVHLDNCPESIFSWLGCAWLGAIAVTTNARSSAAEVSYFAEHAGAVAGITQPAFAEMVAAACPGLRWLAVTRTDNGRDAGSNTPAAADCFDALDADPASLPARPFDPSASFSVQYTSGTTSRPKGVLWTHANALWGARINALHQDLRPDDVHHIVLPLFHTNAQAYSLLAALWVGATSVVQPRFSASRFWPAAIEHGCTWASIVGFCANALANQEVPGNHVFRQWGSGVNAPPTDAVLGVRTMGWWGMTETITHGIVGLPGRDNRPLSIGRPAPEYEIRITEEGRLCEPGQTGELAIRGVRGLSLFAEYLNNPQATADAFDEHGYFLTGDRVRIAEDGTLFFADRSKDMLKVGGENVAASEVEAVIQKVADVVEVAVVGARDPMLDEVPVAFVRLRDGFAGDPAAVLEQVRSACKHALADFKQPRSVRLVEDFPRATLEKIAKAKLRAQLEAEADDATRQR